MTLGKICGVKLRLNNFFLLLLLIFFLLGVLGQGLLIFLVVFWHEISHVIVAKKLGLTVSQIELLPFGGVARIEEPLELDPKKDIKVAIAGPLSNLFLLVLMLGLWLVGNRNPEFWHHPAIVFFIRINIMLFMFNLIPALPLDGGRILRSYLSTRLGHKKAIEIVADLGIGISWILFILGLIGLFFQVTGIDFFLIVIFLFFAARKEKKRGIFIYLRSLTTKKEEIRQNKIMEVREVAVLANIPCFNIAEKIVPQTYHVFLVIDPLTLKLIGKVSEGELLDIIMSDGADILIGQII